MNKETCKICEGKGFVEKKFKTSFDKMVGDDIRQCPYCLGFGFMILKKKKNDSG